jgi:UDP-sugar pyrophosphorylase
MQDFPKLLGAEARVGFTQMDRWLCFSAVKNNVADARKKAADTGFAECGASGEADMYSVHRRKLALCGAVVEEAAVPKIFAGVPVRDGAHIVVAPQFASSLVELRERLAGATVRVSSQATLVLDAANLSINRLDVDGALVVRAAPDAEVRLDSVTIRNRGWQFQEIDTADATHAEKYRIRGFVLQKHEQTELEFATAGIHIVNQ